MRRITLPLLLVPMMALGACGSTDAESAQSPWLSSGASASGSGAPVNLDGSGWTPRETDSEGNTTETSAPTTTPTSSAPSSTSSTTPPTTAAPDRPTTTSTVSRPKPPQWTPRPRPTTHTSRPTWTMPRPTSTYHTYSPPAPPTQSGNATVGSSDETARLINAERARVGAPALAINRSLWAPASGCAIANINGIAGGRGLSHGYQECVYENLMYFPWDGVPSAQETVSGWMNSPAHRQVMLDPALRTVTVAWAARPGTGSVVAASFGRR